MPPPPLTDEEVCQCALVCWEEGREDECEEALGILSLAPERGKLDPERAPELYRREWGKACRYGLAEDANALILAKLEAPTDSDTPIAAVRPGEEPRRLLRSLEQMCDLEQLYPLEISVRVRDRRPLLLLFPFAASIVCLVLAVMTGDGRWAIGLPLGCVLGFISVEFCQRFVKARPDYQINPTLTFRQLAEKIRDVAAARVEEMQVAAERIRQKAN